MLVQITAGTGPIECGIAVDKVFRALLRDYCSVDNAMKINIENNSKINDVQIIKIIPMAPQYGSKQDTYRSILFETNNKKFKELSGKTICWNCESPVRIGHKRKNWFVSIDIIPDIEDINFDTDDIKMELFHSGGNGGQNVNKVETGVRLIHIPSGITVESTKERTQMMNRKDALQKMKDIFKQIKEDMIAEQKNGAWKAHYALERGNPVITYCGLKMKWK